MHDSRMYALVLRAVLALFVCVSIVSCSMSPKSSLGCHKKLFTYKVFQEDSKGRECWDHVSVMSCYGRCDSNEISDWRFPYKRSHHPVCVHSARGRSVATLRHCHPFADPSTARYEYLEAKECTCQACSSSDTSCEGPKHGNMNTDLKQLALVGEDDDDVEY